MPKPVIKVDEKKLLAKMKQYEKVMRVGISQSVRNHARILGIELMHQTQPFSKGGAGKAKELGEGAIAKDILHVFVVLDSYWLNRFKDAKQVNQSLWRKDGTEWLTDKYQLADTLSEARAWLKSRRKKTTGRPPERGDLTIGRHTAHQFMVAPKSLIRKLIREVGKMVGYSKAGWAAAAQDCKADTKAASRGAGIPAWIKRHLNRSKGFAKDHTNGWWNTGGNPRVILTSGVKWMSSILSKSQITYAVNDTRKRYLKFLTATLRAEMRKVK